MMELYVITSTHSPVPLAEVRTDGTNIDWILDNTRGKLIRMSGGVWERLKFIIEQSSHLEMKTPSEATVGLLRYSLENGDIVEITTDGKTAQLNGQIISEGEKSVLMQAISSGQIKIKGKADIARPMVIAPQTKTPEMEEERKSEKVTESYLSSVERSRGKAESAASTDNEKYDKKIESIDFSGSVFPALGKQLLYLLKYGEDNDR